MAVCKGCGAEINSELDEIIKSMKAEAKRRDELLKAQKRLVKLEMDYLAAKIDALNRCRIE